MRKQFYIGLFACALLLYFAKIWRGGDAPRRGNEVDAKGNVIVIGDSETQFQNRYIEAAGLIAKGRVSEAESIYMELTKKEPASPDGHVGLGACRLQLNDATGARKNYETALRLEPRSVNALLGLGSSYSLESDYKNAIVNYELALAVNESSPEAHWGLVVCYAETGKKKDALNHLNRFKELAPNSRHTDALERLVESAAVR